MLALELLVRDMRFAVSMASVVEVAARVHVTPLPQAPAAVDGVCRVRGELAIVVDLAARFDRPRRPALDDHMVIVRTARRVLGLMVDRVVGLREIASAAIRPPTIALPRVAGMMEVEDGILLLMDVDAALGLEEESQVDAALESLAAST